MKAIFFFSLFFINSLIYAQRDFQDDIHKKINVVEIELINILSQNTYIIYGTKHSMLLILKKEDAYFEFVYTDFGKGFELTNVDHLPKKVFQEVFNSNNYTKGYIDFHSKFYENCEFEALGDTSYFSYNRGFQNRYCEYILTTLTDNIPANKCVFKEIFFKYMGL